MKTVAIANQKGGVGKTAVACHLAFMFRDAGHKVLFIDLDPQANASGTLRDCASDVTASRLFLAEPVTVSPTDGITLIPADGALANIVRAETGVMGIFRQQVQALGETGGYDFCVIDVGPGKNLLMLSALLAGHYVLSPVQMESYSIDGITKMIQTIMGMKKHNPELTFLGMLPSLFDSHSPMQKENLKQLLASYARYMIVARVSKRTSVAEALGAGIPVWELPKTSAREAAREMKHALGIVTEKMEGAK